MSESKIHTDTLNLAEIAIRLGAIYEREALLDTMLIDAMNMSNADGGSLYLLKENELHFLLVKNRSLNLDLGRESALPNSFRPIPITKEKAQNLCVFAVQKCRSVNISDVYQNQVFDLEGTKRADIANDYRSESMLTVPIMGANLKPIGVLQLINAQDEEGKTIPFHSKVQTIVEAIANMAAVSYSNTQLHLQTAQIFDSFLNLLSRAHQLQDENAQTKHNEIHSLLDTLSVQITQSTAPPYQHIRIDRQHQYEQKLVVWMYDLQKLLGVQSTDAFHDLIQSFVPTLPLADHLKKNLLSLGSPYSNQSPLSARMVNIILHYQAIKADLDDAEQVRERLQELAAEQRIDATLIDFICS